MPFSRTPADWSRLLLATAGQTPALTRALPNHQRAAYLATFRDEAGHRRPSDAFLLARILNLPPPPETTPRQLDDRLWQALALNQPSPELTPLLATTGPLTPRDPQEGIEITTERELSALHALSRSARPGSPLWTRCLDAAAWHLEHIQPDNATNHPWGIHVFCWLSSTRNDTAAHIHAEFMLHACQTLRGSADRLSAWILADAADWLSNAHEFAG